MFLLRNMENNLLYPIEYVTVPETVSVWFEFLEYQILSNYFTNSELE